MPASQTIVVAGGSGLIGRALARSLAAGGQEVLVLSRSPRPSSTAGVRTVLWDGVHVEQAWAQELAGAAGVVNLAGASIGGPRWTRRRRETILQSRLHATAALVEAIAGLDRGQRPAVLVSASGIDYAGDRGDEPVTEESPPGTTFLADVCARWEAEAAEAERQGVRVVRMRTSLVLDRQAPALQLMLLPFRLFVGGRLGSGEQWFPWIHLEDAVRLYRLALADERLRGPLDLVAPDVRRQKEVAGDLGRAIGRPARVPTPALALRAALGQQADLLLHGQRARSLRLGEFRFGYPTLPAALAEAAR